MGNKKTLSEKIDNIENMLWEDRKFFMKLVVKVDRLTKFIDDIAMFEDVMFGANDRQEEEKILKSIMEDLKNDIEDKKEEFIKYHQMINSDQVGES